MSQPAMVPANESAGLQSVATTKTANPTRWRVTMPAKSQRLLFKAPVVFGMSRDVAFMWTIPLHSLALMDYCTGIVTIRYVFRCSVEHVRGSEGSETMPFVYF